MSFYKELARHYDEIFPVNAGEMRFVASRLERCAAILDVGCGTGNKTEHLAQPGRTTTAIDLDAGMIAQAKIRHRAEGVEYRVADMREIDTLFPEAGFDAVLCLGNTLVHLERSAVAAFIAAVHRLLTPGGAFVAQIINYDRIFDGNIAALPLIETPNVRFTRNYVREGETLHFVTRIETLPDGKTYDIDVVLHPLRAAELLEMTAGAGFAPAECFGGYSGESYARDSYHLVVVATKR